MTLMQDVRATIPGLREAMPDLRDVIPDLREAIPEARAAAMPAIREGWAELRADLPPGPWRKERPSLARRVVIVVLAGVAISAAAWMVMAIIERRRLTQRSAVGDDAFAVDRAEDEGMGVAIGAPSASAATGSKGAPMVPQRNEPIDRLPEMATAGAANGITPRSRDKDPMSGGTTHGR